jgi:tetratricopeptide (TPR) repeat protein
VEPGFQATSALPTVAVLPPRLRDTEWQLDAFADSYAAPLVRHLARFPDLEVVFRPATWRGDPGCSTEMDAHLNADFVLSWGCSVEAGRPVLECELAEAKSGRILLADRLIRKRATLECLRPEEVCWLSRGVRRAVLQCVLHRVQSESPVTLKSPILLAGAIGLTYRLSVREFDHARHLLQTVVDRSRGQSVPLAWLANWHVLRVHQGWSPDPLQDGLQAQQYTKAALDADPSCALALAVDGLVHTNLLKRLDIAAKRFDLAIDADPDNGLAWLWRGTMHAFMGDGARAMEDTARALSLAPMAPPYGYYFDSLAATAYLTASRYDLAMVYAKRSLRANRSHTSTLRVLAIAQMGLNWGDEARRIVTRLRRLEPTLTVPSYLRRTPAADFQIGRDCAAALGRAGLPN